MFMSIVILAIVLRETEKQHRKNSCNIERWDYELKLAGIFSHWEQLVTGYEFVYSVH